MRADRSGPRGFTLIEMLVALSVFAIAALALLRLDGYAVATTADLSGRAMADLVANNRAVELATDTGALLRGTRTDTVDNGGRRFVVTETITPTADARLVRIDVTAREANGPGSAALTLVRRIQ